ncbi:hypothetical protein SAMN05660772_01558 [Pasteurella testudinis DSM 23072]|uniref:Uncharacterized protein n=1 Tax=Pasteurella testudinis DSM 23072 TaxID=1122938 RepID=A0A1W1VBI2_9PAST|nr:hypothetical protein [Pasteurella testudinis]SMB90583.1 hypothetical protein SAMN05660772_01558 [Pasteurella testudinis DSM 23072]SUB52830.1 Uncharacterised protein [Pasteurella testudinis]
MENMSEEYKQFLQQSIEAGRQAAANGEVVTPDAVAESVLASILQAAKEMKANVA